VKPDFSACINCHTHTESVCFTESCHYTVHRWRGHTQHWHKGNHTTSSARL